MQTYHVEDKCFSQQLYFHGTGQKSEQWRIQDFPEMEAPTLRGGGAPTYDFAKISQKLHEIERIWTPGWGGRPKFYYVDPPLQK